jgi:hypothetical protein
MDEKLKEITEEDLLPKFAEEDEKFKKLPETDKKFAYVQQGIATIHSINTIQRQIRELSLQMLECIPDAKLEEVKIISSRCDDINPEEMNDLSAGFMHQLLTVNDKTFKFVCPESVKKKLPMDIEELDNLNFNRSMVMLFKSSSETIATWNAWMQKLYNAYNEKVSDEIKSIISSPDKIEEYINSYYEIKSNDESLDEATREKFKETIKWSNYAYTLEPIIINIKEVIRKSGSSKSIIYGYRNNARVTIKDANKICTEKGFTFPPHILGKSLEVQLLGENYEDYKYLFPYLIARYIKYIGVNMSGMQKVFLTQLFTVMMYIIRRDENNSALTEKIVARFTPAFKELIETIVKSI